MKTLTLTLAAIGIFFAAMMAGPDQGCLFKKKSKDQSVRTKTAKVQGHPVSPEYSQAKPTRPSAFGGEKGTFWTLAETVRNQ
jgi:hypothetical protein